MEHTWITAPTITVTAANRPAVLDSSHHRPEFDADSPTALAVLTPVIGPTAVLILRTLCLVARTGANYWHLADIAGMHGVTITKTRHALTRLHMFGWLTDDGGGLVEVYLTGYLRESTLARLHPALVDHYLGAVK